MCETVIHTVQLNAQSVARRGIFRPQAVDALRQSMHRQEFLRVKQVFSLMTLELWFRIFVDGESY